MNKLYNKLINSIENEVKLIINEQFNIDNMNLDNNNKQHSNIFNKAVVNPYEIYKRLTNINDKEKRNIEKWELLQLNELVSVVKVENIENNESLTPLENIVRYYSHYYPNDSMNWLDVSDIKYMGYLFIKMGGQMKYDYNGDISKWNVSNVTDMEKMFKNSAFNGDIS